MPKKVPVNEVIALSRQGYTDADIIKYLRSEGYSSTEINDAINQAKVKIELARTAGIETMPEGYEYSEETRVALPEAEAGTEEMAPEELAPEEELRPSIMEQEEAPPEEVYAPEAPSPEYEYAPAPEEVPAEATRASYPAYDYGGYGEEYYGAPPAAPAEAVEELAEEIINEKWEEFKAKVGDISELKRYIESRIKQLDDRIKRLELGFDKIQMTMMGQIQASGREVKTLGTEVRAMQGAFSNILQPLVSSVKELRELSEEMKTKKEKLRPGQQKQKSKK